MLLATNVTILVICITINESVHLWMGTKSIACHDTIAFPNRQYPINDMTHMKIIATLSSKSLEIEMAKGM
jgi:hypothetical protein